jgi:hypothetical protein
MKKIISIFLLAIALSNFAFAQAVSEVRTSETVVVKSPLPSFKTFVNIPNINYRSDISFTAIDTTDGSLKGRFTLGVSRCVYSDIEFTVVEDGNYYVMKKEGFAAIKPSDFDWCKGLELVLKMPKKKGPFGYNGTFQGFPKTAASFYGTISY